MRKGPVNVWFCLALCFLMVPQSLCLMYTASGDELSDYLWNETQALQQAALNATVIKGMGNASLDPSLFGAYMVQDVMYLYYSKESIDIAANKSSDPNLKQFLQARSASYNSYYVDLAKAWHIDGPSAITLGNGCQNYVNHLNNVARTMEPIYLVVGLIPCVKLWPYIGIQLDSGNNVFGVYTKWVRENFDPSYKGFEKYEVEINNAYKAGKIDKAKALSVYEQSMRGEVEFFSLQ